MTDSESDRADETKRKVEELIAENKKLKLEKKTLEAALFALSCMYYIKTSCCFLTVG